MAEVTEESSITKTSRHRRDRIERSHRRLRENTGDSPAPSTEVNSSNQTDATDVNEKLLSPLSAERDVSPRKDKRRSKRDEPEANTTEEAGSESTPTGDTPTRSRIKKDKKSENTARKRREKKNLREKRRSTGVVIMPTGESDDDEDEEKKTLKQHTQQNEQLVPADDKDDVAKAKGVPNIMIDDKVINDSETIEKQKLLEKVEEYEIQIDDYQFKLEKVNKELEQVKLENQRLKDENGALLRLVKQLSAKKKIESV